jgi:hypothetical protein
MTAGAGTLRRRYDTSGSPVALPTDWSVPEASLVTPVVVSDTVDTV